MSAGYLRRIAGLIEVGLEKCNGVQFSEDGFRALKEARSDGVDLCIGRLRRTCSLSILPFRRINCKVVGCLLSTSALLLIPLNLVHDFQRSKIG